MLRFREKALRRWEETKQRPNCLRSQHFTFEKNLVKCCLMVPIDIRFICMKRHSACWVVSAIIFGTVNVASPSPYCYRRKYLECRMVYVSLNTKEAIYTDTSWIPRSSHMRAHSGTHLVHLNGFSPLWVLFNESLKQPSLKYWINILPEKRYQCDLWDIFLNVPVLFLLSKNFELLLNFIYFPVKKNFKLILNFMNFPVKISEHVSRIIMLRSSGNTICTWGAYMGHLISSSY